MANKPSRSSIRAKKKRQFKKRQRAEAKILQKAMMRGNNFSNKEMYLIARHHLGIPIQIRKDSECHPMFKEPGILVWQSLKEMDRGERQFGIKVENGVCFTFSCKDYELVDPKTLKS